jgi:hypothetical protein
LRQGAFFKDDGADVCFLFLGEVSALGLRLDVVGRRLVAGTTRIAALVVICATGLLDLGAQLLFVHIG